MNITLYPLGAYVSGYCLPFTIELDGMDQADYGQAVSKGLFEANYKKGDGNVLSSCCQRCGHVVIGSVVKCCKECGGIFIDVSGDERTRKTGGHRRRNKIEYSGQ